MYHHSEISLNGLPLSQFVPRALAWAASFDYFYYFTSNGISYPYDGVKHRLCVGASSIIEGNDLEKLSEIEHQNKYWCGYFAYDLKNKIEALSSNHQATIPFPSIGFVAPQYVLTFSNDTVLIACENAEPLAIFDAILNFEVPVVALVNNTIEIVEKVSHGVYLQQIDKIKEHLLQGDIYEINYCIEFVAQVPNLDFIAIFLQLSERSPMPFAALAKTPHGVVMCASPERFLKKEKNTIISQPIKGTMRRSKNALEDDKLKKELQNSPKEQAENMMIVDLVRSDLAKLATVGSVVVSNLFEVYTFKQVHQMISTVVANLKPNINLKEIIKATFPMGSMTGAPKVNAMHIIDDLEASNRGLYSGTIGLIEPNEDFDFNVVIRSIIYNPQNNQLSFHVGSAITVDSVAEQEYQECMLKAKAIFEVLS